MGAERIVHPLAAGTDTPCLRVAIVHGTASSGRFTLLAPEDVKGRDRTLRHTGSAWTPVFVIVTGRILPFASNLISSMQTTR